MIQNSKLKTQNSKLIAWVAFAVVAIMLVAPVARFVGTSADWLDYPYPRAGSEGLILYESLLVKHGGDLYAPITPERFISGPYPPLYYWLAASVLPNELPDFSTPGNIQSIFLPGRIISLLAALLAAIMIPLVVLFEAGYSRRRGQTFWLALAGSCAGGALFLTLPQVIVWATRFRGDMLMLALTACGLACVARGAPDCGLRIADCGLGQSSKRQAKEHDRQEVQGTISNPQSAIRNPQSLVLLLSAIFFALAFYTKQTALAGPVASALYLLVRDWRLGLKWCAVMAVLVLVPFVLLDVASGHWFYLKMVDYHSLPLRESTLTRLLQFAFLEDQWPLVVLAVGYVVYALVRWWLGRRSGGTVSTPMLIPIFVLTALAMLPTGAVVGADHNHLLVPGLAVCLGVGALAARFLTGVGSRSDEGESKAGPRAAAWWVAAPATLVLVVIYALITSAPSSWYDPDLTLPPDAVREQMRKIVYNARQNPGALLFSDDPGIVALAGKETPYDDPFTMTALARQDRWDESAFRDMLRAGKFSLLILSCNVPEAPEACRSDTLSPGVKDAIRDGYDLQFRDVLFTYRPK